MNFEVFPLIIGWELTLECNMRCRHCGSTAGAKRPNELTTKEALDLCDQFPDLLVQEVDITGGEPLLRKDWTIIAGHLQDLGIPVNILTVNILTNGLVMDSEMIAKMKELDIRAVGLSIDGLREVHDRFRNYRGSYEKTLNAMRLMQEAGIKYNIITTVNKENLDQLPAMHDVFRDLGVRHWRLQPLIPMGRALQNPGLELNDEDMLALGNYIREQAADPDPVKPDIMCSDGLEYVKPGIGGPWRGCPGGIISCGIMSDGRVKGCLSLPDEVCEGNIRDRDLWDIWFDPASFAYTRYFNQEDAGPLCLGCEKLGDCQGGCSSSSYTGTGIFHNDPVCYFRAEHNQNKFT